MRITTVTYSRLRALKQFENERLEMTAEVGPDDDPRIVYERLRGLVTRSLFTGPLSKDLVEDDLSWSDNPQLWEGSR